MARLPKHNEGEDGGDVAEVQGDGGQVCLDAEKAKESNRELCGTTSLHVILGRKPGFFLLSVDDKFA